METTEKEKNNLREIISKLIEGDKGWLGEKLILVGNKDPYWILNYLAGSRNEYNRLVRGMVVQKPTPGWKGDPLTLIRSFPFTRFFNHMEKEADPINFSNAEMLEKMDGTMVGVFFPHNDISKPEFHTRKMLSTHDNDMKMNVTNFHGQEFIMMPIIKKYVSKLKFSDRDLPYTYVFELLHESAYILTRYPENNYGLYLLAGRNIETHRELTEDQLEDTANRLGCRRPRRFDAVADFSEISKMFKEISKELPDFEGFVFRDKETGKRVKVKDPDYVRKHQLLGKASYANLLLAILHGEEEEILAYFPHLKDRVIEIKEMYNKYLEHVVDRVEVWQHTGLKGKDLAVALFGASPLEKWELRLKKNRGEVVPQLERKEPEFIANAILKYNSLSNDDLRKAIDKEMRIVALGSPKSEKQLQKERERAELAKKEGKPPEKPVNYGDPRRLAELIGLKEKETSDVGEL